MTSQAPIRFQGVSFSFKNHKVFENLNFDLQSNQMVSIIGVNGSGKSTLLKMILGLLPPHSGAIQIFSDHPGAFHNRHKVGSALQDIDFPASERVEEILGFVCAQYPQAVPIQTLIEDFDLPSFSKKACGQLSGGMKRRLALACAFAGNPEIILLDEPTTGLDRSSREKLLLNLRKYQSQSKALVLMISHHPEEVADSVDQFLHVSKGGAQFISTERMQQLMELRRVRLQTSKDIQHTDIVKKWNEGSEHTFIVRNSDEFVRTLCQKGPAFENLEIEKIPADELVGDLL